MHVPTHSNAERGPRLIRFHRSLRQQKNEEIACERKEKNEASFVGKVVSCVTPASLGKTKPSRRHRRNDSKKKNKGKGKEYIYVHIKKHVRRSERWVERLAEAAVPRTMVIGFNVRSPARTFPTGVASDRVEHADFPRAPHGSHEHDPRAPAGRCHINQIQKRLP